VATEGKLLPRAATFGCNGKKEITQATRRPPGAHRTTDETGAGVPWRLMAAGRISGASFASALSAVRESSTQRKDGSTSVVREQRCCV